MQIKTQYTHWSGDLSLHAFLSNTPELNVSKLSIPGNSLKFPTLEQGKCEHTLLLSLQQWRHRRLYSGCIRPHLTCYHMDS